MFIRPLPCFIAFIVFFTASSSAQEPVVAPQEVAGAEAARTIDTLVPTLYRSVSFDPGGEPDWKLLRSLLMPNAVFVQPVRPGEKAKAIDTDAFFQLFKDDMKRMPMRERGFYEKVVSKKSVVFGNIAHAFVVFEAKLGGKDGRPARGVDSIQLVRDRGRWWIASITTEFERPGKSIPKEILGEKQ